MPLYAIVCSRCLNCDLRTALPMHIPAIMPCHLPHVIEVSKVFLGSFLIHEMNLKRIYQVNDAYLLPLIIILMKSLFNDAILITSVSNIDDHRRKYLSYCDILLLVAQNIKYLIITYYYIYHIHEYAAIYTNYI